MAKYAKKYGKYALMLAPLGLLALLLFGAHPEARASSYIDPFWDNNSSSPECVACSSCGCPRPSETSPEGVSLRTGELFVDHFLFRTPGKVGENTFAIRWRSNMSGLTQLGRGVLPSWEHTVERVIINQSDPEANGGHEVLWRRPDGLVVTFDWDGTDYSTSDCAVYDTLTKNGSGNYLLTDKYGNEKLFDSNGMPDKYTDRNGNETDFTYNSSYEMTALTDDRGKSYTINHDSDGFITYIDDPASRRWEFSYDTDGNLTQIKTPTTADQTSGITTKFTYDTYNRLTDIEDGRGNTVYEYTYSGPTTSITTVTIDTDDVDFSYTTGRTDRTDRNGNVHRYHYSGKDITKTEMYIGGQAKYVTEYTYTGAMTATIVHPRGNRVDFTYDGDDNMTERRHKTTDTSSTSASDLVHEWEYTNHFVTSYTDPEGNETTYTRDSDGNVTKITYPTVTSPANQTAEKNFEYNADGQLTKTTDEEGKVATRTYFSSGADVGLLEKVEVDPTGLDLETVYEYDSAWNVDGVTNPEGDKTTFTYDNLRRITKRTAPSPLSYEVKYEYDGNGNVTKKDVENVDEDGDQYTNAWITTTYTYNNEDQVLTVVEEIDGATTRTTTIAYDDGGNRIRVTKPEGNKDKWEYNERDLVKKLIRGETSTAEATFEYAYDDNGNLTTLTDGRSNDTDYTYDLFDRRTKSETPLGHYTEWTYDKSGQVTKESRKDSADVELARESRYYDERGRLWKIGAKRYDGATSYSDAITEFERFKTGHLKTVTDARLKETDYTYDAAWRRSTVTDAMGNETSWTYDKNGNATDWSIEEVDGAGTVTHDYEATFDELNRRITLVEIDRTNSSNKITTTYGYDSRGNLVWLENGKGDPTRWTFDAAGRMTKKEVALATGTTIEDFTSAIVTEWGFDKNDKLVSHKDDAGNETTWEYDALDRATEMEYPDLETVTYVYDDNGNITKTTDAAGNVIDDTFDNDNRMTSRSVTRATGFIDTTSEAWAYDGIGRVTKAEDNDYKVEFTHAAIGFQSMPYEEKQSYVGGTAYLKTVKKTYDAAGNKITELYPSNLDLDYTWNDINRLATVTDGTYTIASYTYIGSRVKEVEFQSGATASYSYSGFRHEISRIHHETSTPATILDLQYGYDANHDRTYERYGGSSAQGDAFDYDKARRLTTAWMGSSDVATPSTAQYVSKIEYVMDDDGNRSSVKVTPYGQSTPTTNYTDNNLNQYTNVGGTSRSHDDNGNVTDDGTYTYEYNYKNLICKVKDGATTVATYKYDALGRRVEKELSADEFRYIYSADETVCVYDGSDGWLQDYVFGQEIDEVLMLQQDDVLDYDSDSNTTEDTRSFYHRNALGSVMEITDMNEAVAVSYRYDPYGSVTIIRNGVQQSSDPLGQTWCFTGRHSDEETGLYYYRARYFSAHVGRFFQRDPKGYAPGANLYEYVSSSPIRWTDPHGLERLDSLKFLAVVRGLYGSGGVDAVVASAAIAYAWSEDSGATGASDGPQDAMRHCLWSCGLAKRLGSKKAKHITDTLYEGLTKSSGASRRMDLNNNRVGRACARDVNCYECCRRRLATGGMLTVGPDGVLVRARVKVLPFRSMLRAGLRRAAKAAAKAVVEAGSKGPWGWLDSLFSVRHGGGCVRPNPVPIPAAHPRLDGPLTARERSCTRCPGSERAAGTGVLRRAAGRGSAGLVQLPVVFPMGN